MILDLSYMARGSTCCKQKDFSRGETLSKSTNLESVLKSILFKDKYQRGHQPRNGSFSSAPLTGE